jgi:hypothetical protein
LNIDKDEIRSRLSAAGAELMRPEFLQKRWVFELPAEKRSRNNFMRVRDDGGIITMTWKEFAGTEIDNPKINRDYRRQLRQNCRDTHANRLHSKLISRKLSRALALGRG